MERQQSGFTTTAVARISISALKPSRLWEWWGFIEKKNNCSSLNRL